MWLFGCGNDNIFFNELKERLYSSFCHGWWNHLESSERLAVYKGYKNCFEREKYVDFLWMDAYTGMPLLSSEWVYPRLISISTVFHQQRVMWHAHFVLKKKKRKKKKKKKKNCLNVQYTFS